MQTSPSVNVDSHGYLPEFLRNEAEAHGLPVDVWVRMKQLRKAVPAQVGKMGGIMGDAAHLGAYSWEGVAFRGIYSMLMYLIQTLILKPNMREELIYDGLPDTCKYIPNSAGVYPTLYQPVLENGNVRLTDEIVPHSENISESVLWANGFMPEPTEEMGLRRRMEEWMEDMTGSANYEPLLDAVFSTINPKRTRQSHGDDMPEAVRRNLAMGG